MVLYIVDDEKNIRESIKEYVPWGEFGVSCVITAKNGMEALEKMQTHPPDVVLSDIRMPKMSGIEFATQVKQQYPTSVILFLSGYADKEYLKSAIALEAFQYIEKPIDLKELQDILTEAVSKKRALEKNRQYIDSLEQSHNENMQSIRDNLFNVLISNENPSVNQTEKSLTYFPVLKEAQLAMIYMKINWGKDLSEHTLYKIKEKLLQTTFMEEWMKFTLTGFNSFHDFIILVARETWEYKREEFFMYLSNQMEDTGTYSIGISYRDVASVPFYVVYQEAKLAASFQFYEGVNRVIEYRRSLYTKSLLEDEIYEDFEELLRGTVAENVLDLADEIKKKLYGRKAEISFVKEVYTQLFSRLNKEIAKSNRVMADFMQNQQIGRAIEEAYLLEELHQLLVQHIMEFYEAQDTLVSKDGRIKEIQQYIKKNIGDSQLSVNTISANLKISPTYLCFYFKKETGRTINQYITEVRIEQAKYMILNTNDKIYDIALKVGFSDTNYFSALFKKQVGMTPIIYRKGK